MKLVGELLLLLYFVNEVHVLNNGLALTPPMGWMSWGYYMCEVDCVTTPEKCLNEELILSVVDTFYTEGYQEAGYEYIIIDDCWSEKKRDSNGNLVPNKKRFPRGMKYIADYIHKRGLKFGLYTNIAHITCMQFPGSKGHFKKDAKLFASWEVDYLKVDGCYVPEQYLNVAYIELGMELNKTGRPMVYSCSWPYYIQHIHKKEPNLTQVSKYCNLWRNFHDVQINWAVVKIILLEYISKYDLYSQHHGPGGWNDPDMLILGNHKITEGQSRIQVAVFAMLSAPLLLSCDMRMVTPHEKSLLQNLDLIAIAQDPMGIMAKPYTISKFHNQYLLVKPHLPKKGDRNPSYSFLLVNFEGYQGTIQIIPSHYGLNATDGYTVMDVFQGRYLLNVTLNEHFDLPVLPQDATLYTLYPL